MRNQIKSFPDYEGLPVLTSTNGEPYLYYSIYLLNNRTLLNTMLMRHSKVLFLRIDLRFPNDRQWQTPMLYLQRFLDLLRRHFTRYDFDPQYVIRMEQVSSINPHFHVCLLLNGNKANQFNLRYYKQQLEQMWRRVLEVEMTGLVDFCNRDYCDRALPEGIVIVRPPEHTEFKVEMTSEYREAFNAMSYLAKYVPEDRIPSEQRKVFYSLCNR